MKLTLSMVVVILAAVGSRAGEAEQAPPPVTVTAIDGESFVARTNRVTFPHGEPATLTHLIMKLGHNPYYKYRVITIVRVSADRTTVTNEVDARAALEGGVNTPLQNGDVVTFPVWQRKLIQHGSRTKKR